jgi:large subunit ribosomal protein L10
MPRPEKVAIVEEVRSRLERATGVVLSDYRGLTAQEMTRLRRSVREAGAEFRVVKNTLFRRAAEGTAAEPLTRDLEGPLAVAMGFEDPVDLTRLVAKLDKEYQNLGVRVGLIDRQVLNSEKVLAVSKLPGRTVILGSLVGGLQSPLYGLVATLQGPVRKLTCALQAIAEKRQGEQTM